jgi:DNA modification methylase
MKNNFISSVWNFKEFKLKETNYATHDFLRWYGKLVPQLVSKLINLYSNREDLVLANFAGSGTVLLESNILKRDSIGFDSSPLSILLCKVKTTPYKPKSKKFLSELKDYINKNKRKTFEMDETDKKWYDKKVFNNLMLIKEKIEKLNKKEDKNYFLLALASITRKISRIDSRCINHIVVDKNKPLLNVFEEYVKKVNEMDISMDDYTKISNGNNIIIERGDARKLKKLKNSSIDLVISHPPYLGCINYSNIFKLANKIINYDYEEVKKRDISTTSLPKYMEDMKKVFDEMFRVIKPGKYACIIIGDNRVNGDLIPTFSYFINYALKKGFKLKDIFLCLMNKKAGMSIKRRGNHIDHNYILIFQKS